MQYKVIRTLRRNSSFLICSILLCLVVSDPYYLFTSILWLAIGRENYSRQDFIEDAYRHSPQALLPISLAIIFMATVFFIAWMGMVDSNVKNKWRAFVPILSSSSSFLFPLLWKIELSITSACIMYAVYLGLCILLIRGLHYFSVVESTVDHA
jgi:hypothetical protein